MLADITFDQFTRVIVYPVVGIHFYIIVKTTIRRFFAFIKPQHQAIGKFQGFIIIAQIQSAVQRTAGRFFHYPLDIIILDRSSITKGFVSSLQTQVMPMTDTYP